MKIFRFLTVVVVAMLGFTACESACEHDFIEVNYSKEIVGTWTCMEENYSAAFAFNADGSIVTTGVREGQYWKDLRGAWSLTNNKLTINYQDVAHEFLLEIVPGKTFSIVGLKDGVRNTFDYCAKDLSEDILGMWVCNDGPLEANDDVFISTFNEDGQLITTGNTHKVNSDVTESVLNGVTDYTVAGNLLIYSTSGEGTNKYGVSLLNYIPNGTALGDILYQTGYTPTANGFVKVTSSMLRVKQELNLKNKDYSYNSIYITNVKGEDKDIPFQDSSFNFAKLDGSKFDQFLKSVLYGVKFANANVLEYNCVMDGKYTALELPIYVEGNKVTIATSSRHEAYRDVVLYVFQSADDAQLHMYMHTSAFESFFSNLSLSILSASGQLDLNDEAAVAAVHKSVADAIASINVSIVMKATK